MLIKLLFPIPKPQREKKNKKLVPKEQLTLNENLRSLMMKRNKQTILDAMRTQILKSQICH